VRDTDHTLRTIAAIVGSTRHRFLPEVIIATSRISSRRNSGSHVDVKYGLHWRAEFQKSYLEAELSSQSGDASAPITAVVEGSRRFDNARVEFAGWIYPESYVDLSAGSKSGSVRQTVELDNAGFSYSDRRRGHEGGLFRTIVKLSETTQLTNSVLYGSRDRHNANTQFLSGLIRQTGSGKLRLDHLMRRSVRTTSVGRDDNTSRRTRLEYRYRTAKLSIRSYIAYNTRTKERDCLSFFARAAAEIPGEGQVEFWGNIGRIDHRQGQIEYMYLYAKHARPAFENVMISARLSYRYDRGASARNLTTVSIGMDAQI
jgi:hypothetical protein